MAFRAPVLLLLTVAWLAGGCTGRPSRASGSEPAAFSALLADGILVGYSASGEEVGRVRIGGRLPSAVSGGYIAKMGRRRVVVLDAAARTNRLVVVDIESWSVVQRTALPRGIVFRNVTVGARTGRFYLAGDRPTAATTPFGSRANAAALAVVTPNGRVLATVVIRSPSSTRGPVAPYDWSVYSIAADAREERVYVSYHGPNTSGADSISVAGLTRCAGSGAGGVGCIAAVHGRVGLAGDRIVAAGGTPPVLLGLDARAGVATRWQSGFASSAHLMEFAYARGRVFGLESCPKLGGLTTIDLERKHARMLAPPARPGTEHPRGVCGERIAVRAQGGRLAVAKTSRPHAFVLVVDGGTGRVLSAKRLAHAAVDVAALD